MEREKRNRSRGSDAKKAALQKIREARTTGTIVEYEIGEVDNIFEEVDENEYEEIRDKRAGDWLVGDDDRGYHDHGDEFYEDSDDEKNLTKEEKKKLTDVKKKKKFAEGSGNITSLFLKSRKKKKVKSEVKINDDDELNDILREVDDSGGLMANMKRTPKMKKRKIKLSMSSSSHSNSFLTNIKQVNSSQKLEKRTMIDNTKPPAKKIKLEETTKIKEEPMNTSADDFHDDFTDFVDDSNDDFVDNTNNFSANLPNGSEKSPSEPAEVVSPSKLAKMKIDSQEAAEVETPFKVEANWEETMAASQQEDTQEVFDFGDDDNNLIFYWLDAYESQWQRDGKIYITGRTKEGASCCVVIQNIPHTVYFLPKEGYSLQDVFGEVEEIFERKRIKKFKSRKEIKKNYFAGPNVPSEAEYLRVEYEAEYPTLEKKMAGVKSFEKIFCVGQPAFELFCLERKIYGPCWLTLAKFEKNESAPVSWCKEEYISNEWKSCSVHAKNALFTPKLTLVALSLKSSPKRSTNELIAFSMLVNESFKMNEISTGMPRVDKHIHGISRLDGNVYPYDWDAKAMKSLNNLECCMNEKQLLNFLLNAIRTCDPDIIVGHDLLEFGFEFLLQRMKLARVSNWSRLGRIRRKDMPKFGTSRFSSRAGFACAIGRLVADIKISAKELIKMKDYDLTALSKEQITNLKDEKQTIFFQERREYTPEDIQKAYEKTNSLRKLADDIRSDAYRCMLIANKIQAVPLALQITNICGNILSKTLQGGRAERNSYLLLHAFHEEGHLPPEKLSYKNKSEMAEEGEGAQTQVKDKKKKAKYAGGLVLEPKRGLYTKYILLLDFNSLYPSIIQEYNLCFTTTEINQPEGVEDWLPDVPDKQDDGILPRQIKKLVERRREIKKLMKTERDETEYSRLNIRQLGLKLTANSMYGCLGFQASRFFAQPLAALITAKGREILNNTKSLVEGMGLEVVYGDTDSIMINSNSTDYNKVMQLGNKVKQEINKHYRLLEIDIDGAYKSLLLLRKKKYAALAAERDGDVIKTKEEFKGLDIVRRDWSNISRQVGGEVLSTVLHEEDQDVAVSKIHEFLETVGQNIRNDKYKISDFIIHKALTKAPEQYPKKGDGQPHVVTALRMNKKNPGKYKAGDTVTYIICDDNTENKTTERAYHPSEVARDKMKIDHDYYLSHQLMPVLSRLLDPIEATEEQIIATHLGLDPKNYKSKASLRMKAEREAENAAIAMQKDEEKLANCDTLEISVEGTQYELEIVFSAPFEQIESKNIDEVIAQLRSVIREKIGKYYENWKICRGGCGLRTRKALTNYNNKGDFICPECGENKLQPEYSYSDLYLQLLYYQRIFSLEKWKMQLEIELRNPGVDQKTKRDQIQSLVNDSSAYAKCTKIVQSFLAKSAFRKVDLTQIFSHFFTAA